ncbi:hypothetical protein PspLS_00278 [Pyricularia sp. CBS 133598]|nr:hypothetical protein PspLS_00278 [Pyricularia sp. CBS 133598]
MALLSTASAVRPPGYTVPAKGPVAGTPSLWIPDSNHMPRSSTSAGPRKRGYYVPEDYKPPIPEGAVSGQNTPTHNDLKAHPFKQPGPLRQLKNLVLESKPPVNCPITVYKNINEDAGARMREKVGTYRKLWTGTVVSNAQETFDGVRKLTGVTVRFGQDCTPYYTDSSLWRKRIKILPGFREEDTIRAKWTNTKFCYDNYECVCAHVTKDGVYSHCY